MSFFSFWSAHAPHGTDSTSVRSAQHRFDDFALDAQALALAEARRDWRYLADHCAMFTRTVEAFCDFLSGDLSLLPAVVADRPHFVAHHVSRPDGTKCENCERAHLLVHKLRLQLIEMSNAVVCLCMHAGAQAVQQRSASALEYEFANPVDTIDKFAKYCAQMHRHMADARSALLSKPTGRVSVHELFATVCAQLDGMRTKTQYITFAVNLARDYDRLDDGALSDCEAESDDDAAVPKE